jgi:hypothetical protein
MQTGMDRQTDVLAGRQTVMDRQDRLNIGRQADWNGQTRQTGIYSHVWMDGEKDRQDREIDRWKDR